MSTDTKAFLDALYPEPFADLRAGGGPPPRLVIWIRDKHGRRSASHWTRSTAEAVAVAAEHRDLAHVYFGVCQQNEEQALELARRARPSATLASVRGGSASVAVIPAIWVDLDIAGPTHSSARLPPDRDAALGLLAAVPRPPTALVRTGGGLHAYWLLREPWLLETAADRAAAGSLVARLQAAIRASAAEHGWAVDTTADLARVLRLPGSLNHKTTAPQPVEVEYLFAAPERRYNPEDFDMLEGVALPAAPSPVAPSPAGQSPAGQSPVRESGKPFDYGPPASFAGIWRCGFIRWAYHRQKSLDRYSWLVMISIVARSASAELDGAGLCHKMSDQYPKYTAAETDTVIRQMTTPPGGPCTCAKIAERSAFGGCKQCAHRVRSPIVLGRRPLPASASRGPGAGADDQAPPSWGRPPARKPDPPWARGRGSADTPVADTPVEIAITTREREVADQALAALARREPNLFRRGGVLTQVVADDLPADNELPYRAPQSPAVRPLHEPRMRELLATHCSFFKTGRDARPAHPPQWLARALIHRNRWPAVPRLEGLVEGPVLRPDGTVLQTPGYDQASGLFMVPGATKFAPVPEKPTGRQVEDALMRLREVVCDFPFSGPAHMSAWLAALLTPLARYAFAGPSPVNLIDANTRGSGKSLLADVCHLIITGRPAARMPYSRDESEMRKSITAIALKARQMVVIDNVSGPFGSPTLDLAVTTTSWGDRLLGQSVDLELPLYVTWVVTGNNIDLRGDMPRRCLHIRLDTPLERPEHRGGFRHRRLLEWLAGERRHILPAALTLLAAYRAEARPPPDLRPWGSFEGWSDLVRGTITWLGLPDPAETCAELSTAADAGSTKKRLLLGLREVLDARGGPATVHNILGSLETYDSRQRFSTLVSALVETFPRLKADDLPTPAQLGRKLRSLRGRVIGGLRAVTLEKTRRGVVWAVERAESVTM